MKRVWMKYFVIGCFLTLFISIPYVLFLYLDLSTLPGGPTDLNLIYIPPILFFSYIILGATLAIYTKIRYKKSDKIKDEAFNKAAPIIVFFILLVPVVFLGFVIKPLGPPTHYFFVKVENNHHMEDYGLEVSIKMDSEVIFYDEFLVGSGGDQLDAISFEKHTFEIVIKSYDFNRTLTEDIDFHLKESKVIKRALDLIVWIQEDGSVIVSYDSPMLD